MPQSGRKYYAFAESVEPPIDGRLLRLIRSPKDHGKTKFSIALRRRLFAQRTVWFDCFDAHDFDELIWRSDEPDYRNPESRAQRRAEIGELRDSQFRVARVMFNPDNDVEVGTLLALSLFSWHLIEIGPEAYWPALVSLDYEGVQTDGEESRVTYLDPVPDEKREELYRVFNVDFIDELGAEEDPDTFTPEPLIPAPGGSGKERNLNTEYVARER